MNLTPEQKQTVTAWVTAGDNLSTVQKKLLDQFQITMTYRDVRFLVDDLDLALKDRAPKVDTSDVSKTTPVRPAAPAERSAAPGAEGDEDEIAGDNFPEDEGVPAAPPAGTGQVTVEVDRLIRPGAMVSGNVTFSDGVSGKWALDQSGRLMLDTGQPNYKPSAADVQVFQRELSVQLQRQGF